MGFFVPWAPPIRFFSALAARLFLRKLPGWKCVELIWEDMSWQTSFRRNASFHRAGPQRATPIRARSLRPDKQVLCFEGSSRYATVWSFAQECIGQDRSSWVSALGWLASGKMEGFHQGSGKQQVRILFSRELINDGPTINQPPMKSLWRSRQQLHTKNTRLAQPPENKHYSKTPYNQIDF